MVLTTGVWPMSQQMTFEIPTELSESIEKFTTFYQGRHNGRRLSFLLTSSRGELLSTAFSKRYTFVVSCAISKRARVLNILCLQTTIAQMSILMLYNRANVYTIQQFVQMLNIKRDLLISSLQVILKGRSTKTNRR